MQCRIGLNEAKQLIALVLFALSEGKEAPDCLATARRLAKHYNLKEASALLDRASL